MLVQGLYLLASCSCYAVCKIIENEMGEIRDWWTKASAPKLNIHDDFKAFKLHFQSSKLF